MNRTGVVLMMGVVFICVAAAHGAMRDAQGELDLKVTSEWIWRGRVIHDEPSFQPSVTLVTEPFSFNIWGNWDLENEDDSSERRRVDLSADYTFTNGPHIVTGGINGYIHDDNAGDRAEDTYELFVRYAYDTLLYPAVVVYYDFGEIEGVYAAFEVAHRFPGWNESSAVDLALFLGLADSSYNEAVFGADVSGLVDLTLQAAVPVQINESFLVTPAVKAMTQLDSEIRDASDALGGDNDGVAVSLSATLFF